MSGRDYVKEDIEEKLNSLEQLLKNINSMPDETDSLAEEPQKLLELGETLDRVEVLISEICGLYCIYVYGLEGPNPDKKEIAIRKASGKLFSSKIEESILKAAENNAGHYITTPESEKQVEKRLKNYEAYKRFHSEAKEWLENENTNIYRKILDFLGF